MATIAVFVALGGSGYAAVTVSGSNIRNKSVSGKKLKNRTITRKKVKRNTLTGTEVNEAKLKRVGSATNADKLDGQDASDLKLRCPDGTRSHAAACIETHVRPQRDWNEAALFCGTLDRRLPTLAELESFRQEPGIVLAGGGGNYELTSETFNTDDGSTPQFELIDDEGNRLTETDAALFHDFRCVARPVN
jgi:hypothetical protein